MSRRGHANTFSIGCRGFQVTVKKHGYKKQEAASVRVLGPNWGPRSCGLDPMAKFQGPQGSRIPLSILSVRSWKLGEFRKRKAQLYYFRNSLNQPSIDSCLMAIQWKMVNRGRNRAIQLSIMEWHDREQLTENRDFHSLELRPLLALLTRAITLRIPQLPSPLSLMKVSRWCLKRRMSN